jgi:hypothetical protein
MPPCYRAERCYCWHVKKLPKDQKAQRLSTSIPAELNDWLASERTRLAEVNPIGERPSLASLVAHALYEYKEKLDQRAKEDMKNAGEQMGKAAKKVPKKKG